MPLEGKGFVMMRLGNLGRGLTLAVAALIGTATTANAAPMLFNLEGEHYGELGAQVLFTYTGTSILTGRVDVQVTNTSTAYDPRLTGFAFNLPGTVLAVTNFTSSLTGWAAEYDRNDIDTPGQFGFYDVAGLTGSGLNGGSPNFGIARTVTANFSFNLLGIGMMGLTESSFLNLLSNDPGRPNEDTQYFIARFQRVGPGGGLSDVATPDGPPTTPPTRSVPEPTTLMLSGLGMLGLATVRRRAA
jgi:hypothetical protein